MAATKRHAKRATTKKGKKAKQISSHVMTIPQLRKAFEHVETFVELHSKQPKKELVELFQEEWKKTFHKQIDHKEAVAYVEHALKEIHAKNPKYRKHSGGAVALSGASVTYDTRPGLYTSPGVDDKSYAHVPAYVDKGFWNPVIGRQYDPVPGQTTYPSATPYGLGSNRVTGGRRTKKKGKKQQQQQQQQQQQEGGGIMDALNQFIMRPVFSYNPPTNILDTAVATMNAKVPPPASPDPSQTVLRYQSNLPGTGLPLASVSSANVISNNNATNPKVWYP